MRDFRRKIYDKRPIITDDLFLKWAGEATKADTFLWKINIHFERLHHRHPQLNSRGDERSKIIFTHDLLIFYVNFKCIKKEW